MFMDGRISYKIKQETMDGHSSSDSRKRPLDSDGDDATTKRSNQGNLGKMMKKKTVFFCIKKNKITTTKKI